MLVTLATWEAEIHQEDQGSRPAPANSSQDPISKMTRAKLDWRCGSSGRAPALQVQSPPHPPKKSQNLGPKICIITAVGHYSLGS
jgi:hypothetical protein